MLLEKAVAFLLVFALLYALAVGVLAAASASNKRYLAGCEDATCTDPEQLERLFLISHKKIGRGEVAWHHLLEWDGIAKVRHQMQYGSDHCPPRCPHCSTAAEQTARRSEHSCWLPGSTVARIRAVLWHPCARPNGCARCHGRRRIEWGGSHHRYWRVLEGTGGYCRVQEGTGAYCRVLEGTAGYWRVLERTGG